MLDEECLRPGRVSDDTLLEKLSAQCATHAHFASRGCRKAQSDKSLPHDAFRLQHYAGAVRCHGDTRWWFVGNKSRSCENRKCKI